MHEDGEGVKNAIARWPVMVSVERAAAGGDATDNPGQRRGEAAETAASNDQVRAGHWSL